MLSEESETDARPWTAAERSKQLQRLHRALTDDLLAAVAKDAKKYGRMLRKHGIACAKGIGAGEELVQNAVLAMIEGRRRWDGQMPLDVYLKNVIRSQVSSRIKAAERAPEFVSLEAERAVDDRVDSDEPRKAEAVDHATPRENRLRHAMSVKDAARRLLAAIQTAAPLDLQIRRVLNAWGSGHVDRADAIDASGLTVAHYDATCKRIKVIVDDLPEDLLDGAVDALEVSYVG